MEVFKLSMRRKDKEITDVKKMEEILNKAEVLRLAMCDDGEPYLVAMNFAFMEGCIYMHSAREGRKIDILKKNGGVAFQTDTDVELLIKEAASECTTRYQSVFGTGTAVLVDEKEEKISALDAIMAKYTGKAGFGCPDAVLAKTAVIKVQIETMTGKRSGFET